MKRALIILFFLAVAIPFIGSPSVFAQSSTKAIISSKCNEFTFDATESYDPDDANFTFLWDFGDGSTSQIPIVKHTYKKAGDATT